MNRLRVGIVGATGYSGAVGARLVAMHPHMVLAFATSDRLAGKDVEGFLGIPCPSAARFVPNDAALDQSEACDVALLATAADVSLTLVPAFAGRGKSVVDLSGAFRLAAGDYPRWYGFEHTAPSWLERAHYGLPELFGAPAREAPSVVANPGCYPTAALLALGPLLREGLIEPGGLLVDAKSGVTGAGRQTSDAYSFVEVEGDLRAYRVLGHQHTPEIERALSQLGPAARVTFTAHLLPMRRGLFATCYGRPRAGATAARVAQCLADAYGASPFVRVLPVERVMLKGVVGTNACHVGATADENVVIAVAALDNLLKGAAGQAVQNLNLMNGWKEIAGLDSLQRFWP